MSANRYHLVCDGFRNPSANKTQLSLALKQQLALTDAQLADLMASRPTVLARNLGKEKAQELGRKLVRAGLSIKVETAQINQKISAGELRDHLRDGGLSHYFAGRYHHPEEDIDTRISLLILAALPVFSYVVLLLIGLALGLPLLNLTVWLEQTLAATTQGLLAALCWIPLYLFRPRSRPAAGVKLDAETESLAFELVDEISHYIDAPQVASIRLTHSPFLRIHQTHWLWLRRQTDLEIGLPYLETLTLQQFAGDLILQLAPLAPRFHSWTWGLYLSWHQAVAARFPMLIHRLDAFVQPMHEHQQLRQDAMVQALIGHKEARRVRQINQRLLPIAHQWGEGRRTLPGVGHSSCRADTTHGRAPRLGSSQGPTINSGVPCHSENPTRLYPLRPGLGKTRTQTGRFIAQPSLARSGAALLAGANHPASHPYPGSHSLPGIAKR